MKMILTALYDVKGLNFVNGIVLERNEDTATRDFVRACATTFGLRMNLADYNLVKLGVFDDTSKPSEACYADSDSFKVICSGIDIEADVLKYMKGIDDNVENDVRPQD